ASDSDGQAITSLTANVTGLPAGSGATFTPGAGNTTGTLRWTPTFSNAGGPFNVIFTASNAASGSATTAISVTNVDRAPLAAAPATATVRVGRLLTVNATASDPDGDAIVALATDLTGLPPANDAAFTPGAGNTTGALT